MSLHFHLSKKFFAIFISLCLLIASLPSSAIAEYFLSPPVSRNILGIAIGDRLEQKKYFPKSREDAVADAKKRLGNLDLREESADDFYWILGDIDRLSRINKQYSKGIIGGDRDPQVHIPTDTDIVFARHSLFRELLSLLAEESTREGFDIYRHLAGDEFILQCGITDAGELAQKLEKVKNNLNLHFTQRYGVARLKIDDLPEDDRAILESHDDVLNLVRYADGYRVLLKLNIADYISFQDQLDRINKHLKNKLVPHAFTQGVLPPFSASIGAVSIRSVVRSIEKVRKIKIINERGHIKNEFIDEVYVWGMRIADDMLKISKQQRNTVYVSKDIDPRDLHTPISAKKQKIVPDGIDGLTGFYKENAFREKIQDTLISIEVATYNGKPSREKGGFHAVNDALTHDPADEVIKIVSEEIKNAFITEGIHNAVYCRAPPDRFFVSFEQDIDPETLKRIVVRVKQKADQRLQAQFHKKFSFNTQLKVSTASSHEVNNTERASSQSADQLKSNVLRIVEAISTIEKAVEMLNSVHDMDEHLEKALTLIKVGESGEVRIFDSSKRAVLEADYRLVQAREEKEAIAKSEKDEKIAFVLQDEKEAMVRFLYQERHYRRLPDKTPYLERYINRRANATRVKTGEFIQHRRYNPISFLWIMGKEVRSAWKSKYLVGLIVDIFSFIAGSPVPVMRVKKNEKNRVELVIGGWTHGTVLFVLLSAWIFWKIIVSFQTAAILPLSVYMPAVKQLLIDIYKQSLVYLLLGHFLFIKPKDFVNHELLHAYQYYLLMNLRNSDVLEESDVEGIWESRYHKHLENIVARYNNKKIQDMNAVLSDILHRTIGVIQQYIEDKETSVKIASDENRASPLRLGERLSPDAPRSL